MSLESDLRATSCRKALKVAVAALCSEAGFEKAEESAVETLTEMIQSCKWKFWVMFACYLSDQNFNRWYTYWKNTKKITSGREVNLEQQTNQGCPTCHIVAWTGPVQSQSSYYSSIGLYCLDLAISIRPDQDVKVQNLYIWNWMFLLLKGCFISK